MAAPVEIIHALESVVDIYFSGVKHRERAAFILCDNLVEMACKTKAREHDHKFNMSCNFHDAVTAKGCRVNAQLRREAKAHRNTRNNMQHATAAATVSRQLCADAVLNAASIIDSLWRKTSAEQFPPWLLCAMRIVTFDSTASPDRVPPIELEDAMRDLSWRGSRETLLANEVQIRPGIRDHWGLALRTRTSQVEQCLNELDVPPFSP